MQNDVKNAKWICSVPYFSYDSKKRENRFKNISSKSNIFAVPFFGESLPNNVTLKECMSVRIGNEFPLLDFYRKFCRDVALLSSKSCSLSVP